MWDIKYSFVFFQRDTALSKKDSNISIHKKLLSQIVEYEHAHVKVSFFQILKLPLQESDFELPQ